VKILLLNPFLLFLIQFYNTHYLAMQQPTLQMEKPLMRVDNTRRVSLPIGTNITLKCTGHSNTNISRYLWNSTGTFQTLSQSPTLSIQNASVTDSGFYYCYTVNIFGDQNGSLPLNIIISGEFKRMKKTFFQVY